MIRAAEMILCFIAGFHLADSTAGHLGVGGAQSGRGPHLCELVAGDEPNVHC